MPEDAPGNPGAVRPDAPTAPQGAVYRKVREMQAKLHRWAGEDHSRRFGDLFNLVCDLEFLAEGWHRVRANAGSRTPGIEVDRHGFVPVDRVSRTSAPGIYAAGDCTGVQMLASVAAMQGRIAMWHALGEAVQPIRLSHVASTIFTDPEIASVGVSQATVDRGEVPARVVKLPLATNPRAKMGGFRDGFVKVFARPGTGLVLGGVVVAPRASELILPLSIAIEQNLTVEQIAHTFSIYPSLSGSVTEAARTVMEFGTDAIA